jgi:hypothetical protein
MKGRASAPRDVPSDSRGAYFHDEGGPYEQRYDGREIVGLDLHRHRTVMVRMTPGGERLEVMRFANDPAVLAEQVAKAGAAPEVVLEATYGWYWAADALAAAGRRCIWRIRWG